MTIKQEPVGANYIYTEFMSNKLLFKPFFSWPNCVYLGGLNKADSISNKLLKNITLRTKEHLLWVSYHTANWKAKDIEEKTPSGCIVTDQRICYFNLNDGKNNFSVEWSEVASIKHHKNCFYIQKSLDETSYDLKIDDYALLNQKVKDSSPVVSFLNNIAGTAYVDNKLTPKESSSNVDSNTENTKASAKNVEPSTNEKQTYQFTNRNDRLVQANEEPKASKKVRRSFL